jgi:hypothetical protein
MRLEGTKYLLTTINPFLNALYWATVGLESVNSLLHGVKHPHIGIVATG